MLIAPNNWTRTAAELLDALPNGILLLDSDGTLVHANAAAHELVRGLGTTAVRRCRDLFSCQAPGGPCERGCLVARAASLDKPSAEVRIDTPGGVSPGALWVTASPISGEPHAVLLQLRAGSRHDRRRRSDARWQTEPELRIRALGWTNIEALEDSLETDWLAQRPGQILKYLVCERARVVMVDEIAESIWPDGGAGSIGNARYSIHRLRMKLEPRRAAHDPPAFVVARAGGYALDRARIWIDVDEFERAVKEGRAAMLYVDSAGATQHLEHAMGLYRGAFLADEPYAQWASDERHRLAGLAIYALRILTVLARERTDALDAIGHLRRLAELEPLDNGVYRELVQALLGEGLRSEATRQYASFAHRLREMGVEPGFDVLSLSAPLDA